MTHSDDELRVHVIEKYDVLNRPPRRELEALVELAAIFTGVPMATINLFTRDEQVQIATYGFVGGRMRREASFCTAVVEGRQPVLLEDARGDERFAQNPHTTGELGDIRFYGAHPLVTPEGVTIGTLCVYDEETHPVTPQAAQALKTLADRVVDALELEFTSRQLARANERLGAFAGQVSHDLRNPLAAVRMSLELAQEELAESSDPGLIALLQRAERGIRRMDDMIGELLMFARVGASLEPEAVDLSAVVRDVVEDLAGDANSDQFVVGDVPTVHGDAAQLRVLLQNLLGNAVKFSPTRSPVTISASALDSGWRVTVSDRGPGVPPEHRERIFDPMVRLSARVPGTGIGLATSRRIVEAHGGRIGVVDNPDGGAAFWFELPG